MSLPAPESSLGPQKRAFEATPSAFVVLAKECGIPHNPEPVAVLDKGFVRLVDHMGGDLSVVRSARVSHDADWRAGEKTGSDTRLINYLMEHRHVSPFEAVEFTFEVKAPIFILRQWYRHRTWSPNEVSGRYVDLGDPEFYIPDLADIGKQASSNKQGRDLEFVDAFHNAHGRGILIRACDEAARTYRQLIGAQWPRELARMVLPLNTYTRCFLKVNLRNVLSFLDQRLDPHAQLEIQRYAQAIRDLVEPIAPVSLAAWESTRALH